MQQYEPLWNDPKYQHVDKGALVVLILILGVWALLSIVEYYRPQWFD